MNPDDLEAILIDAAVRRAKGRGFALGQGADHDIRGFARVGAGKVFGLSPGVQPDRKAVDDATSAFERLIDAMVEAASTTPN